MAGNPSDEKNLKEIKEEAPPAQDTSSEQLVQEENPPSGGGAVGAPCSGDGKKKGRKRGDPGTSGSRGGDRKNKRIRREPMCDICGTSFLSWKDVYGHWATHATEQGSGGGGGSGSAAGGDVHREVSEEKLVPVVLDSDQQVIDQSDTSSEDIDGSEVDLSPPKRSPRPRNFDLNKPPPPEEDEEGDENKDGGAAAAK